MRKLTLDLGSLVVQSFATNALETAFGTVRARETESSQTQGPDCSELVPCSSDLGCGGSDECPPTANSCPPKPLDTNVHCSAVLPACRSLLLVCTRDDCPADA